MTPRLSARELFASYGSNPALRGLDADIPAAARVAILGENGAGKSTFLKLVARILRPEAGQILLDGKSLLAMPRRETARRIAYVPQSVDLVFPIRCLDLVLQGRAPHRKAFVGDGPQDRRRALDAMKACDVLALADRDASALSGGEKRRVFLARALAQEAEIWLLDEPTAGLDPRHRLEFLEILARVHRDRAATVLLVTHELELAGEIADRILLLRDGRTLAQGSPEEVLTEENLRQAFAIEARVSVGADGRRRVVPVAPLSDSSRLS